MSDVDVGQEDVSQDPFISGAGPLIIMIIMFGMMVLITLMATVERGSGSETGESSATIGYGPEHFPAVYRDCSDEQVCEAGECTDEVGPCRDQGLSPLAGLDPNSDEPFQVPPPPFREPEDYPCSMCHEGDPGDPTPRELTMYHDEINLNHDEEHRWCLDCHLDVDRDFLRLANGTPVAFEESYLLCGQCHGTHRRDWEAGAHGRRTGSWDGAKRYLLCVHCHDSHSPAFQPIAPLPPPLDPYYIGPRQGVPAPLTVEGSGHE